MRPAALLLLAVLLAPAALSAYKVALKDGQVIEFQKHRVSGDTFYYLDGGTEVAIPLASIDRVRTTELNKGASPPLDLERRSLSFSEAAAVGITESTSLAESARKARRRGAEPPAGQKRVITNEDMPVAADTPAVAVTVDTPGKPAAPPPGGRSGGPAPPRGTAGTEPAPAAAISVNLTDAQVRKALELVASGRTASFERAYRQWQPGPGKGWNGVQFEIFTPFREVVNRALAARLVSSSYSEVQAATDARRAAPALRVMAHVQVDPMSMQADLPRLSVTFRTLAGQNVTFEPPTGARAFCDTPNGECPPGFPVVGVIAEGSVPLRGDMNLAGPLTVVVSNASGRRAVTTFDLSRLE